MRHYYNKNIKKLLIICPILNLQGCKGMPKLTTNNNLRMIIPISEKNGVIMISYTDNKFAKIGNSDWR